MADFNDLLAEFKKEKQKGQGLQSQPALAKAESPKGVRIYKYPGPPATGNEPSSSIHLPELEELLERWHTTPPGRPRVFESEPIKSLELWQWLVVGLPLLPVFGFIGFLAFHGELGSSLLTIAIVLAGGASWSFGLWYRFQDD